MRIGVFIFALALIITCYGCSRMNAGTKAASTASISESGAIKSAVADSSAISPSVRSKVDFSTQIKPIFEARCQPCHFSGGKVYAKMPFDRPETIKTLGTKLFTRIKDENERQMIRDFLSQ
jgi:hypothetical protein